MWSLAHLINYTPLAAMMMPLPDGEGGEALVVVVKAAFDIDADGEPHLCEAPAEIRMADAFIGDPARGLPLADADLALHKPRVDVLIHGARAYAPRGREVRELFAELHVGHSGGPRSTEAAHDASQAQLIKSVKVTGDRVWLEDAPGEAMPFVEMPLGWERTYGGTIPEVDGRGQATTACDERNPFGIGWKGARSADEDVLSELPNIEDPDHLIVRRDSAGVPVGFGTVARAWLPRRALAGTFDEAWRRERWPGVPEDWDPAYHQSAPTDQQLERYGGSEPVRLVNLTPEGEWLFRLPTLDVPIALMFEDRLDRPPLRVDTVEIEPEARRVTLTGRVTVALRRGGGQLYDVVVGHAQPGWVRARMTGKDYVDLRDLKAGDGADRRRACYR